jgi:hypothetical protein
MNNQILNTYLILTSDNAALSNYVQDPQAYFQSIGMTDATEQQMVASLIHPFYEKLNTIMNDPIQEVNKTYREGLMASVKQTIAGYRKTMTMYQVSFYLGVALIVAALLFAVFTKSSLFSILFGSIGAVDLLTFLIARPPHDLQESRAEQAKLNVAFYSWFINLYNWNSFFLQYNSPQTIPFDIVKNVSEAQIENTERLMSIISEKISKPAEKADGTA